MSPIAPDDDCASGVELALPVDDRREKRRVEVVVLGVPADDVLVLQRVAQTHVPGRLVSST